MSSVIVKTQWGSQLRIFRDSDNVEVIETGRKIPISVYENNLTKNCIATVAIAADTLAAFWSGKAELEVANSYIAC